MKIGFIGLGIMGSRMAMHLHNGGHTVTVHNRTEEKATDLVEAGANWAATPTEAAQGADVVISMLAHPEAVRAMALGEGGFLAGMESGSLWIDCSTVHPMFSREMAAHAAEHRIRMLDAPVAGSLHQAAEAQLLFIVGGIEGDVEHARPLFDVMGRAVLHAGGQGMGASLKLVLNHLLGTSMVAFSEGLLLGEALGIPQERLLELLIGTAVVPAYMGGKRDKIANDAYTPEFPLRWMHKDMHLVSEAAYETGISLPVSAAAKAIFGLALQHGVDDVDFSAIYAYLRDGSTPTQ